MKLPWHRNASSDLPRVIPVSLSRHYKFMYEATVLSDQHATYLFLEAEDDSIAALVFDGATLKFGAPNDEVLGNHPLMRFGLGYYGFFEVLNSPWRAELMVANRVHPRHDDEMFSGKRHFIATFKDTTFEIIARGFQERSYTADELTLAHVFGQHFHRSDERHQARSGPDGGSV